MALSRLLFWLTIRSLTNQAFQFLVVLNLDSSSLRRIVCPVSIPFIGFALSVVRPPLSISADLFQVAAIWFGFRSANLSPAKTSEVFFEYFCSHRVWSSGSIFVEHVVPANYCSYFELPCFDCRNSPEWRSTFVGAQCIFLLWKLACTVSADPWFTASRHRWPKLPTSSNFISAFFCYRCTHSYIFCIFDPNGIEPCLLPPDSTLALSRTHLMLSHDTIPPFEKLFGRHFYPIESSPVDPL